MASFGDIPDEVIRHVLLFISADDNLRNVQLVSRRLRDLADEPLLWRHHCRTSFRYWAPEHGLPAKLAGRAADVNWRALCLQRRRANTRNAQLLDQIIASQVDRLARLQDICVQGYDAKDFLLEQRLCHEDAEDALARKYFANLILGSIHRGLGIHEWFQYRSTPESGGNEGLGRALAAFDMFVLHDSVGDIDDIQRWLVELAAEFRNEHPRMSEWNTRRTAMQLLQWVRRRNLTGIDSPEINYRNIRNCLIGQALSDEEHPSLPIISSAIYCCLAEKLGLQASCLAFPSHVHTAITAPAGETLNGLPINGIYETDRVMYLDPYGSDDEVYIEDLRQWLAEISWNGITDSQVYLAPSPTAVIVQRTAKNIEASWGRARELVSSGNVEAAAILKQLRNGNGEMNMEAIFYGAMWADLLMKPPTNRQWDENLEAFLGRFVQNFREDAWIVERYLMPVYETFVGTSTRGSNRFSWENVGATLGMVRNLDKRAPTVNRRYTQEIRERVQYRVGQVFKHRRYDYVGIINGWSPGDTSGLPRPHSLSLDETDNVLELDGEAGQSTRYTRQSFYSCMKAGVDRHVIAQDNIQIITDASLIPDTLMLLAGKFFRRFDRETCTFVSNIKEFYPDD